MHVASVLHVDGLCQYNTCPCGLLLGRRYMIQVGIDGVRIPAAAAAAADDLSGRSRVCCWSVRACLMSTGRQ